MAYTLDGTNLGTVTSERHKLTANIIVMTQYLFNSASTYVFDYGGVTRKITITSKKTGSLSEMTIFINTIEALMNGAQDRAHGYPKIFNSDVKGNLNVKIEDFDWDVSEVWGYDVSSPTLNSMYVVYTLVLVEASTLA